MAFAAHVEKANDMITGLWRGAGAIPVADESADHTMEALTEAEHVEIREKGLAYAGAHPRWKWDAYGDGLQEQADPRIKIGFSDPQAGQPTAIGSVLATVGDANVNVDVLVMLDQTTVDTSYNGDIQLNVSDGRWVTVAITAGYGSLSIVFDKPKEFSINDQGNYNVLNPLKCRVFADAVL